MATDFKLKSGEGFIIINRGDIVVAQVPFASEVKAADNTKPAKAAKPKVEKPKTEAPKTDTPPATEVKGKGRPKKGFTLLYGLPKRHKGTMVDLQQVMHEMGGKLAEEWNAGSFWAIDAFKRREALAHKAQEIAEGFGPALVVVTSDQRDLADFAAALEPFAVNVYYGIA